MKKMRRLIPAIAMLLVSAVMLSTASFAWFTISTSTQVTGMEVTAVAGSSLLIVDAKETPDESDFKTANGILPLGAVPTALQPATSEDGVMKTVDPKTVDPATGLATGALTTDGVTEANNYYYDYVVAIGSAGAATTGKLVATINPDSFTKTLHNAVSVDFLLATTKAGTSTYIDKVHFDESANGANDLEVVLGDNVTSPLAVTEDGALNDYIVITMRVYFDGALTNDAEAGTTYVRNYYMTDDPIGFDVTFDIEE